ncbi:MAG: PadR family transcriptional regulator [Defluviitaleaceae bacterium]|nr:PadR family transcriptional regulator [Defluviitaleaceae bacterium]
MGITATGTLLDGCVLSFLRTEDAYGYNLTQRAKETLEVSESTLYPVMRRLQTDGFLSVYDIPHNGRNRRYYRITESGMSRLDECRGMWVAFRRKIDGIFFDGGAQ